MRTPARENGETFTKRFGAGNIGMMGTGNFQITLVRDAESRT